ncbi:hypothetical protein [Sphingobacterium anhuiense]|uniref:hypothetical protein n=1 Tax=Sphingobacterium anhuiense TaxID=493780 RepID=UPI003C303F79
MRFLYFFLLFFNIDCFAQDSVQVYLHLDRGAYFPGDTIRYKAYLLKDGVLDQRIKNLYMDWFGADGEVIENSVHLMEYGMVSGQYAIPTSYKQLWINTSIFTNVNNKEDESHYIKNIPVLYDNIRPDSVGALQVEHTKNIANELTISVVKPKIITDKRNIAEKRLNQFRIEGLDEPAFLTVSVSDVYFPPTEFELGNKGKSKVYIPTDFQDSLLTINGKLSSVNMDWGKFMEKYEKAIQKSIKKSKSPFTTYNFSFGYKPFADSKYIYSAIPFDRDGFFHIKGLSFTDTLEFRATHVYEKMKYDRFDIEYNFFPFQKRNYIRKSMPSYPYTNKEWLYDPLYVLDTNRRRVGLREIVISRQKKDGRLKELDEKYPKDWFKNNKSILDIDAFKEQEYFSDINDLGTLIRKVATREGIKLRYHGYYELLNNKHAEISPYGFRPIETPPINEVIYIKVYDKYPYNPIRNGQGAFMFYTTGIDRRNVNIGRKVKYTKVGGYKVEIPYWKKEYKSNDDIYLSSYDDRISLFWDSNVNLNANQNYYFEFYNNSRQGDYIITVQGFTLSGKPVFAQEMF